jgi:hypothetical protein
VLVRTPPPRTARPRFKARSLADEAEVDERRDRVVMQRTQRGAAIGPSQLLGHSARSADVQYHRLRGCEIHRASVRVYRKSIRHELHGVLLLSIRARRGARRRPARIAQPIDGIEGIGVREAANFSDRMNAECCDF